MIGAFMERDHHRLNELFQTFQTMRDEPSPDAADVLALFRRGLLRHIAWEDDLLFPLHEHAAPSDDGPTRFLRFEHEQIKAYLERIGFPEEDGGQTQEWFEMVMSGHNEKEENSLYPWLDKAVPAGRRASLLARMRAQILADGERP